MNNDNITNLGMLQLYIDYYFYYSTWLLLFYTILLWYSSIPCVDFVTDLLFNDS